MSCADCPVPREACEAGASCPTSKPHTDAPKYECPDPSWNCDDCIELERGCYSPARQQERTRMQVKVAPRWQRVLDARAKRAKGGK